MVKRFCRHPIVKSSAIRKLESAIDATVHQNRLTSNVGSAFGGEPDDCICNLLRLSQAAEWNILCKVRFAFGGGAARCLCVCLRQIFDAVRGGIAGADIVDRDVVRAVLRSK